MELLTPGIGGLNHETFSLTDALFSAKKKSLSYSNPHRLGEREIMSKSARQIRELKKWLGVPQTPEVKPNSRIQEFFERSQTIRQQEQERRKAALIHQFEIGRLYLIDKCTFRYVGKQGKHHCFVSSLSGWSRTYTDAQLIGKSYQEVTD